MGGMATADATSARGDAGSTSRVGGGRRARRLPRSLLLTAALVLGLALFPTPAAGAVADVIDATLRSTGFSGEGAAVYIWDLDTATPIYELNPAVPLAPASNLKLVTSVAAVFSWGFDHRFRTELYAPETPPDADGVLSGNIHLRGRGDPTLSTRGFQKKYLHMTTASFENFAQRLKREGVRKIDGKVLGDASWFDRLPTVPVWTGGLQSDCGPISALSGNQGLENGRRVAAPATFAARLMTQALRKAGVKVTGGPGTAKVPDTARLVDRQYSARLRGVLRHLNKESDNFFAEMILKGLGKDLYGEGSTTAGIAAAEDALGALDIAADTYVIQDGSGLSYGNRLTAHSLTKLLGAMRQRNDFDDFYGTLAVAGRDGTLQDRMRGTAAAGNAHAKTGTLNIASSLAGYVTSANGHLVAFAILFNDGIVDREQANSVQDRIVVTLAKASLPGTPMLTATPLLRQHSISAVEPVHGVGGELRPGVQP